MVILESMKMEMPVEAEDPGTVKPRSAARRASRSRRATSSSSWNERRPRRPGGSGEGAGRTVPRRREARPRSPGRGGRTADDLEPRAAQRARPRDPRRARRGAAEPRPGDRDPLRGRSPATGEVFSAGYDIADIPEESFAADAEALVAHPFHAAMEAVSAHPYPVLAAINGHCLGGGLELAVRCDLRLCAMSAKLGMPPAKLGLIYGHTGLQKFIDVVGVARTKELFLTGRNLSAPRAMAIGLVHDTVPDGELGDAAARAGLRGRRQRPAFPAGQQARDRDPQLLPAPDPGPGARADRAAALVLRLRGLPRGHPGLRREAKAPVARALAASARSLGAASESGSG